MSTAGRDNATAGLTARRVAAAIIADVAAGRTRLDAAMDRHLAGVEADRERAFVTAVVMTTLRRLGEIDRLIAGHVRKALPAKAAYASAVLRLGVCQLVFLRTPAHAAVDSAVSLVAASPRTRHLKGLVNAVLRAIATRPPAALSAEEAGKVNTPAWLFKRWRKAHGDAVATAIAAAHMGEPALDISVVGDSGGWAQRLGGVVLPSGSVRIVNSIGPVERLAGYGDGQWWVQDAAAALPARLFGDVTGKRVLDMCAAPGGKALQLAAAGADVTALELSPARARRLADNVARTGLNVEVAVGDAATFAAPEPFDAVLLDAPCSATGTIRRNPDVAWHRREEDLATLTAVQDRLLDNAHACLRPGGVLVYATCSLEPEEGEGRIAAFLSRHGDMARQPVTGMDVFGADHLVSAAGDLRTFPHLSFGEASGMDGFYACRLERSG